MAIAITAQQDSPKGTYESILLSLAFSGSYPTGGDTLDFTSIINTQALADVPSPTQLPICVDKTEQSMDGYYAEVVKGSALNNWKLRVWQPGGTEYAAGAYGAPFTNSPAAQVFLRLRLAPGDR